MCAYKLFKYQLIWQRLHNIYPLELKLWHFHGGKKSEDQVFVDGQPWSTNETEKPFHSLKNLAGLSYCPLKPSAWDSCD